MVSDSSEFMDGVAARRVDLAGKVGVKRRSRSFSWCLGDDSSDRLRFGESLDRELENRELG